MTRDPDVPAESSGFHRPHVNSALVVSVQSVAWTVAASSAAVALGIQTGTAVLVAFGAIGIVDAIGSIALVYHFHHGMRHDELSEELERLAHSVVLVGLFLVGCAAIIGWRRTPDDGPVERAVRRRCRPCCRIVRRAGRAFGKETTDRASCVQQRAALRRPLVGDWRDPSRGRARWNSSDAVARLALGRRGRDHDRRVRRGDPRDLHLAGRAPTLAQNPPSDDRTPHRSLGPRDHRCHGLAVGPSPYPHRAPRRWTGNSGAVSAATAHRSCQHLGRRSRGSTRGSRRNLAHLGTCNMDRRGRSRRHHEHGARRSHRSTHPQNADCYVESVTTDLPDRPLDRRAPDPSLFVSRGLFVNTFARALGELRRSKCSVPTRAAPHSRPAYTKSSSSPSAPPRNLPTSSTHTAPSRTVPDSQTQSSTQSPLASSLTSSPSRRQRVRLHLATRAQPSRRPGDLRRRSARIRKRGPRRHRHAHRLVHHDMLLINTFEIPVPVAQARQRAVIRQR